MSQPMAASLVHLQRRIIACARCPRLRAYCERVAREKKRAYRDEAYWGRPVPGFGDPAARLLVVGLAPAAHGANRTGRMFTGDSSGDFLARALHRAGFASVPASTHAGDGLRLLDAYVTASARCAPPDNKPLPSELEACFHWLRDEAAALPRLRVVIALGRIAFATSLRLLRERGLSPATRPAFAHGALYHFFAAAAAPATPGSAAIDPAALEPAALDHQQQQGLNPALSLLASYHPSRQNTNTGRLTEAMFDQVFGAARAMLDRGAAGR